MLAFYVIKNEVDGYYNSEQMKNMDAETKTNTKDTGGRGFNPRRLN